MSSLSLRAFLTASLALVSSRAFALQPLGAFLDAARTGNSDNREASALTEQRAQERGVAWSKLAPVVSAAAVENDNQYESSIDIPRGPGQTESIVVTPKYQSTAAIGVSLPLVDVGSWNRIGAAKSTAASAEASQLSTGLDVAKQVTRAYYQLVSAVALVTAAEKSEAAAAETLKVSRERLDSGMGSKLDVRRAESDLERARQDKADADYSVKSAARSLETLTGLVPEGTPTTVSDDLHEEAPLETWESKATPALPPVAAAARAAEAADKQADAARSAYLPTLSANFTQTFTNAAGLVGQERYYVVGLGLNWRLDPGTHFDTAAQLAAWEGAKAREDKALKAARDDIYLSWQSVRSQIAKAKSARAGEAASDEASSLTQERYKAGTATILDVITAERDAFSSAVSRIQADGELLLARALLRLSAGMDPEAKGDRA